MAYNSQIIRAKKAEVLSKFTPDFALKFYFNDATFHNVVEMLARDADPYAIIELLIEQRIELINNLIQTKQRR